MVYDAVQTLRRLGAPWRTFVVFACFGVLASFAAPPTDSRPVVDTYNAFWLIGQNPAVTECHVKARMYVLCHFTEWNSLWVEWDNEVHYLDGTDFPAGIKTGQWIDVDGDGRPDNQTIRWKQTTVTPVPDLPPPSPVVLGDDAPVFENGGAAYAELTGLIDDQSVVDTRHIQLNLVFGGTSATVYFELGHNEPIPAFTGTMARILGVLSVKRDANAAAPKLELWCSSMAAVRPIGTITDDPRFNTPVTPIESIVADPRGGRVRVHGRVYRQEPGRS
ncbi:MAG TPA: hypothetical protein VHE61_08945, partial [Opitutaceae bacterium]|nr:hypothetical protein [Opitutaceae bacterium]